ncbi:MAG: formate dehydrogenase accessory sulfurtransferase FdhD [Myxococcales bacterium]|nr:formate dehydrogenase accessory sulfurtransferase FdhD [Myxococcales bacterium]
MRAQTLWRDGAAEADQLVVEAPLELHLDGQPLAVLMRTPGEDLDLAAGFLVTEGLAEWPDDLHSLGHCTDPNRPNRENVVKVTRAPGAPRPAERGFVATAGCGLCGKRQIEDLFQRAPPLTERLRLDAGVLAALPETLRAAQPRFAASGGLHGAALVTAAGDLVCAREDVGRHNAVDKVLGAEWRADRWPLEGQALVVSSRAGFEILQKALVARVGAVVAVGAASTLAHDLAVQAGLSLYSFVRGAAFNAHQP